MSEATHDLQSRIEAVAVHRRGARVTRAAWLEPGDGALPGRVRLVGLPLCLDDSSVRVRIEAAAEDSAAPDSLPLALDQRVGLDVALPDASLPPPRDEELRQAILAEHLAWDRVARTRAAIEQIDALPPPQRPRGRPGAPPPPPPDQGRLALLQFRRRELERLHAELNQAEEKHRLARETLEALKARHELGSSARQVRANELRKTLIVALRPPRAATSVRRCRLIAEYFVPGASWAPAYALHFTPDFGKVWLELRALVCQRTGEDWRNVALTLSTAEPLAWTDLPELPALRIGRRQPPPPRLGWRELPRGAEELYADHDRALEALKATARREQAARAEHDEGSELFWQGVKVLPAPQAARSSDMPPPATAERSLRAAALPPPASAPAPVVALPLPAPAPPSFAPAPAGLDDLATAPMPAASVPCAPRRSALFGAPRESAPPPGEAGGAAFLAPTAAPEPATARGGLPPAAGEAGLEIGAELLGYSRLRMPPPSDPQRGKLRPASLLVLHQETLLTLQLTLRAETLELIVEAQQEALAAARAPLPPGHRRPSGYGFYDHAYRGEHPAEVPADGAWHAVPLLAREAPSELRHVTVPRLGPEVFRCALLVNPLAAPLLEGPADVFVGSDYLLTGMLHDVPVGGQAELGLGVEQGIRVARNTRYAEREGGLLSDTSLEHEIAIELQSHLPRAARVEVRERIPVPREGDRELSVEGIRAQPPWEPWQQPEQPLRGGHRWQVDLPPGGRSVLTARYVVKLPAKWELAGGNRREE